MSGKRFTVVWSAVGFVLLSSCDGSGSSEVDASATDAFSDAATEELACRSWEQGPVPDAPAGCAVAVVQACPIVAAPTCLANALQAAAERAIQECQVSCGDGDIGFQDGCAAAVNMRMGPIGQDAAAEKIRACIRDHIIGVRWQCAPVSGWARLFLGSCTLL